MFRRRREKFLTKFFPVEMRCGRDEIFLQTLSPFFIPPELYPFYLLISNPSHLITISFPTSTLCCLSSFFPSLLYLAFFPLSLFVLRIILCLFMTYILFLLYYHSSYSFLTFLSFFLPHFSPPPTPSTFLP